MKEEEISTFTIFLVALVDNDTLMQMKGNEIMGWKMVSCWGAMSFLCAMWMWTGEEGRANESACEWGKSLATRASEREKENENEEKFMQIILESTLHNTPCWWVGKKHCEREEREWGTLIYRFFIMWAHFFLHFISSISSFHIHTMRAYCSAPPSDHNPADEIFNFHHSHPQACVSDIVYTYWRIRGAVEWGRKSSEKWTTNGWHTAMK